MAHGNVFLGGTTVICSIEVYSGDTLTSPTTSMTIDIYDPQWAKVVSTQAMEPDGPGEGKYHYDYTTTNPQLKGIYQVRYIATNNSRVSRGEDWFELI